MDEADKKANGESSGMLDWEVLNILLGQTSVIDTPSLHVKNIEEAHEFIKSYGYDLEDSFQEASVAKLRMEALAFMERHLLRDPDGMDPPLSIPKQVRKEKDLRKILLQASIGEYEDDRRWCCSLLRVMHAFTHVHNDLGLNFFPEIQKQILERVLKYVYTDVSGNVFLGKDSSGIPLYMMDIKSQKSSESMVLKLLHKVGNMGSDIFDRLGFRFVTYSKLECLLALQYLQANIVFAYPNVKTSRSRNSLINHQALRKMIEPMQRKYQDGDITYDELIQYAKEIAQSPACQPTRDPRTRNQYNLYSSTDFSSIQITCRQLIRIQDTSSVEDRDEDDDSADGEYNFFFPFEIQILDKESYIDSRRGRASHEEYKRKQLRAVRQRVFPWMPELRLEEANS